VPVERDALLNLVRDSVHKLTASRERRFAPVPLVSDVYLSRAGEEGRVVRCLAERKREGHPPQLRIVCRVHTHDNGPRQAHRQEVRRDTYDITTGTWRMKPRTAYVMRGPCRSVCSATVHIFNSRFPGLYVFTIHLTRLKRRVSSKPRIDNIGKRNQVLCVWPLSKNYYSRIFLYLQQHFFYHICWLIWIARESKYINLIYVAKIYMF